MGHINIQCYRCKIRTKNFGVSYKSDGEVLRKFLTTTSVGFGVLILMGFYFKNDPRCIDGQINISEMSILEALFFVFAFLSVISTVVVALNRTSKRMQTRWMFLILFVWPASYYYLWKFIDYDENKESSLKDITRRANKKLEESDAKNARIN